MRGAILGSILIGLGYLFNTQLFDAEERARDNKGRPVPKIGVNKTGNNYWGKQSLPYHMWKYRHPACLRVYAEGWGVDLKTLSSKEKAYLKELYDEDIDTQNALKSLIRKHGVRATKAPSDLKGSSAPVKASTTSSTQTTLVGGGGFGSVGGFGMPLSTTPPTPPKPPSPPSKPTLPPTDIPQVKAMLALDFMKHGHAIQFPAIAQRKLDGVRCLASNTDGKIILQSRQNNAFSDLEHIKEDIQDMQLPSNIVLDGELYSHAGKLSFQKLAGMVRRHNLNEAEREEIKEIRYHVYDMIDLNNPDRTFTDRHAYLKRLMDSSHPNYIDLVENFEVGDVDEADELHSKFVQNGYEGLMFRNKDSPYEGKRSRHLQKYKKFDDDEFEIVGYEEARGKDIGSVIWVLQTEDGQKFRARPTGTIEERRKMFTNGDSYIGKMLTVKYFGLTDGGIPRFPIGITVRDYEAETFDADVRPMKGFTHSSGCPYCNQSLHHVPARASIQSYCPHCSKELGYDEGHYATFDLHNTNSEDKQKITDMVIEEERKIEETKRGAKQSSKLMGLGLSIPQQAIYDFLKNNQGVWYSADSIRLSVNYPFLPYQLQEILDSMSDEGHINGVDRGLQDEKPLYKYSGYVEDMKRYCKQYPEECESKEYERFKGESFSADKPEEYAHHLCADDEGYGGFV